MLQREYNIIIQATPAHHRRGEAPRLYLSYLSVARCARTGVLFELDVHRDWRVPPFPPYDLPRDLDLLDTGSGNLELEPDPLPLPNQE
jgi:hypothetical protein